jgi:hypothetical protein
LIDVQLQKEDNNPSSSELVVRIVFKMERDMIFVVIESRTVVVSLDGSGIDLDLIIDVLNH